MSTSPAVQDYSSHKRYVVGYHFVAYPLLLINLVYAIYTLVTDFSASSVIATTTGVALILALFYARAFAVRVQDRVIRLEERLRLAQLLPEDLKSKIESLSVEQLVALRFASDAEIPALTRRVLTERIADREEVKKLIKDWRPDNARV